MARSDLDCCAITYKSSVTMSPLFARFIDSITGEFGGNDRFSSSKKSCDKWRFFMHRYARSTTAANLCRSMHITGYNVPRHPALSQGFCGLSPSHGFYEPDEIECAERAGHLSAALYSVDTSLMAGTHLPLLLIALALVAVVLAAGEASETIGLARGFGSARILV